MNNKLIHKPTDISQFPGARDMYNIRTSQTITRGKYYKFGLKPNGRSWENTLTLT